MTQKEAIEEALHRLGGRARLRDIYPLAIELGNFSRSKDKKATIRNCLLTNLRYFRPSPDKPKGWWELTSFQEEIAKRDQRIKELTEENERLKVVKTEDDFVRRLWHRSNMRGDYNKALEQKKSLDFQTRLREIFG